MKKTIFMFVALSMLVACKTMQARDTRPKIKLDSERVENTYTPETLKINGVTFNQYTTWGCSEYSGNGDTVLELVRIDAVDKKLQGANMGFILFDGNKEYAVGLYKRRGINHRWDWDKGNYSFVIKPDGTGLYYDFTTVKSDLTKPSDFFKCEKYYK